MLNWISSLLKDNLSLNIGVATATSTSFLLNWSLDIVSRSLVAIIAGVGSYYIIKLITLIVNKVKCKN